MYSYDDRMRAVSLYIKLGRRVGATICQLGVDVLMFSELVSVTLIFTGSDIYSKVSVAEILL